MQVYCEDPREAGFEEEPGCRGFPTAMTRRKVKGDCGQGSPKRAKPSDMNPDEEGF
jgi:hypothetical protein